MSYTKQHAPVVRKSPATATTHLQVAHGYAVTTHVHISQRSILAHVLQCSVRFGSINNQNSPFCRNAARKGGTLFSLKISTALRLC